MDARERLVDGLVRGGRIRSGPVEAAFRAVPRHLFLPGLDPVQAYEDAAIPTHWDPAGRPTSSSSQPSIMALMLEQLDVRPGHRVLEVGTGTGYNAALLAHLAGPTGRVTTIDIAPDVSAAATDHLRAAGLDVVTDADPATEDTTPGAGGTGAAGVAPVRVVVGDGAAGWPAGAPYDRIVLTAAARDLAPAWSEQLAGRLVLPLALRGVQLSVAFERAGGCLASVSVLGCGFMALRGDLAGPETLHPLEPGLYLDVEGPPVRVDLSLRGRPVPVLAATPAEVGGGLRQWLALREPGAGTLIALDRPSPVPPVTSGGGAAMTLVLVEDGALAAVVPGGDGTVAVQAYGSGDGPADRLLAAVRAWDAAERPGPAGLRVRACAPGTDPGGADHVDAPHTRFLLDHP